MLQSGRSDFHESTCPPRLLWFNLLLPVLPDTLKEGDGKENRIHFAPNPTGKLNLEKVSLETKVNE
jgi:hypothetical protein